MLQTCLLLLAACDSPTKPDAAAPGDTSPALDDTDAPVAPPQGVSLHLDRPALDPWAGGAVQATLQGAPGEVLTVTVAREDAVARAASVTLDAQGLGSWTWDGHDEAGQPAAVGAWRLGAVGLGPAAEAAVQVIHTGFVDAFAEDDDGVTATWIPMFWVGDAWLQDAGAPIAHLDALDDGVSTLSFPPPTSRYVQAAAVDGTLPTAWSAGSRPMLHLTLAAEAPSGLGPVSVELEVPGWTILTGSPLQDGVPVLLQRDAPLDATLGRSEEALDLALVAVHDGTRHPLSRQQLPLRLFRLAGPPTFAQPIPGTIGPPAAGLSGPEYQPWAVAMDEVLTALEGTPADAAAVPDAVVDWVFNDLGLVYDTSWGASYYSDYRGSSFAQPEFYFADFLRRIHGSVINCSDATNITLAYTNSLGVALHHIVILNDFPLNYIRAIGTTDFTRCPFGPGVGCGFSYHAVATPDGGGRIWDATLNLDGDPDPRQAPSADLPVQDIAGEEYLERLTRSGRVAYRYGAQVTLR